MKHEVNKAGNPWKVKTVNSGANPDYFEFPDAIPQDIVKGTCTGDALAAWDKGGNRNRRPAD